MNGKDVGKNVFAGTGAVLLAAAVIWVFSHASSAKPHAILSGQIQNNYEKIQIQLEAINGKLDRVLDAG